MGGSFSFRDWYSTNGDALNETRRSRYASDPDYRQRVLETNRESRRRQRAARKPEPKKIERPTYVVADLEGRAETFFTISAAAKELGCSVQTIRLWERKGVIPPAAFRSGDGPSARRVYTSEDIKSLRTLLQQQGRLRGENGGKPERTEVCLVRLADGTEKEVPFESAGSLARALGLSVSELDSLERQGVFPQTGFRSAKSKHRLYTPDMVRKAAEIFRGFGAGIGPTTTEEWREFHVLLSKAWSRGKLATAKMI